MLDVVVVTGAVVRIHDRLVVLLGHQSIGAYFTRLLDESTQTLILVRLVPTTGHSRRKDDPQRLVELHVITSVSRFTHVLTVDPVPSVRHDTADWPRPHELVSTTALSRLFTHADTLVPAAETTWILSAVAAEIVTTATTSRCLKLV